MFWNGNITKFQIASIKSFISNGFKVYFWSYKKYELPNGVISKNANDFLKEDFLNSYACIPRMYLKNNAYSEAVYTAQSDIIRFLILQNYPGWWSDCDVFCKRPAADFDELFESKPNICAGFVDDSLVNSAVIAFPNIKIAKLIAEENQRVLGTKGVLEFGELNLEPLNHIVKKYDLLEEILPYQYFYPHTGDTTDFWSGKNDQKLLEESLNSYTIHWENSFDHKSAIGKPASNSHMLALMDQYLQ